MTLDDYGMYDRFWQHHPPTDLLAAAYIGWKRPPTTEQRWAEGAMNPAETLEWFRHTGGKIAGVPHG